MNKQFGIGIFAASMLIGCKATVVHEGEHTGSYTHPSLEVVDGKPTRPEEPPYDFNPLTIELIEDAVTPSIVVGGSDDWVAFTAYTVTNPNSKEMRLDSFVIEQSNDNGSIADFAYIQPVINGQALTAFGPGINSRSCPESMVINPINVDLDGQVVIAPGATIWIELQGQMAPTQPSSVLPDEWGACARSGHTPSLGLRYVESEGTVTDPGHEQDVAYKVLRNGCPNVSFVPSGAQVGLGDVELGKVCVKAAEGQVGLRQIFLDVASFGGDFESTDAKPTFTVTPDEGSPLGSQYTYVWGGYKDGEIDMRLLVQTEVDAVLTTEETCLTINGNFPVLDPFTEVTLAIHDYSLNEADAIDVNDGTLTVKMTYPYSGQLVSTDPSQTLTGVPPFFDFKGSAFIWTDFSEGPGHVGNFPTSHDYAGLHLVPGAYDWLILQSI